MSTTPAIRSPFDALAQTSDDGTTYWSARDLAPAMGYDTWQNFTPAVDRAMVSAASLGMDVTSNFMDAHKITATRPAADYHLTRQAAYLVAMNGDPRKAQVAAAQAYFAQSALIREGHMEDPDPQPSAAQPTGVPVHVLEELTAVLSRVTDVLDRVTSTPTMATTVNVGSPAPVAAPEPETRERGYYAQRRRDAGVLSLREFCRDYLGSASARTMASVMKYLETRGLVQPGGSRGARSVTQRVRPTAEGATFLTSWSGTTSILEDAAAILAVELRRAGVVAK